MDKAGSVLRKLMRENAYLISPCAFDALSAKAIEKTGFKVAGTTGQGMHGVILGQPDNGLLAFNEMVEQCGKIADAVNIPILCDGEGGYGNAINVIRTVREFEKAGVAGLFLEDQKLPPNCPFIKKSETISMKQMCGKIHAAVDARHDDDFVIVARTDAPFEEAVERAYAYMEAGADMIKPIPKNMEELEKWPKVFSGPLHVGFMSNVNAGITAHDIGKMGYKFITFPLNMLFMYAKSCLRYLSAVMRDGTDAALSGEFMTFEQFQSFIGIEKYKQNQMKYVFD